MAWAARVALAMPAGARARAHRPVRAVSEPWRRFVRGALQAQARFDRTVHAAPGAARSATASPRSASARQTASSECWQVADRGRRSRHALAAARHDGRAGEARRARPGHDRARRTAAARTEEALRGAARVGGAHGRRRERRPRPPALARRPPRRGGQPAPSSCRSKPSDEGDARRCRRRRRRPGQRDGGAAPGARGDEPTPPAPRMPAPTERTSRPLRAGANLVVAVGHRALVAAHRARPRSRGARIRRLGQTSLADAYNLANTTPNIVYELLLGGILSATLVPVFVEPPRARRRGGDDAVVTRRGRGRAARGSRSSPCSPRR